MPNDSQNDDSDLHVFADDGDHLSGDLKVRSASIGDMCIKRLQ